MAPDEYWQFHYYFCGILALALALGCVLVRRSKYKNLLPYGYAAIVSTVIVGLISIATLEPGSRYFGWLMGRRLKGFPKLVQKLFDFATVRFFIYWPEFMMLAGLCVGVGVAYIWRTNAKLRKAVSEKVTIN